MEISGSTPGGFIDINFVYLETTDLYRTICQPEDTMPMLDTAVKADSAGR